MANTFYREAIGGSDKGIWDTYELPQNRNIEGNISCKLYDDSGTLKITKGRIGFNDGTNRGTMVIDTVTTISMASVSNGNWAKIEMALSSGAPVFTAADISGATDSTTIPSAFTGAWDGDKQGYYIDSAKRCVGLAWKTSGGSLSGVINTSPYEEGYYGNSEDKAFLNIKGHDLSSLISVSGNIGIGEIAPTAALHVSGSVGSASVKGIHVGMSGDNAAIELKAVAATDVCFIDMGYASGGDYRGRILYDNSADTFVVYTNGANVGFRIESDQGIFFPALLGSTGGSDARYNTTTKELFYDTSARKYKQNIRPTVDTDTDFLHSIPVKKYDRKDGSKNNEIGIIAEDLQAIRPDLVCHTIANKQEINEAIKNNQTPPAPILEVESYSKGDLVPYLLLEIQKLKREIDKLKKP